jgi:hypothetical protein
MHGARQWLDSISFSPHIFMVVVIHPHPDGEIGELYLKFSAPLPDPHEFLLSDEYGALQLNKYH